MLSNVCYKTRHRNGKIVVAEIFCFILCIKGASTLARVDSNWSQRRPNATVAQNQWTKTGYRPAAGDVAYQQPYAYNRNNQTLGQQPWHLNNNRSTQYQPSIAPLPARSNQILSNWNQTNYGRNPLPPHQGALNQTRPVWPQTFTPKPANPASGQGSFNQSRPFYTPQNSAYGQTLKNQSRLVWPQPSPSHLPSQNPVYSQKSFNQSRPTWSPPSAPYLTNNSLNPVSNLYPPLPNNPNSKPAMSLNSWTPSANQTLLYPQLPNQNKSQPLPAGNNNGIPLAALQPQSNPQGPHNWHSGGQSALSYGPGYFPPPTNNTNKTSSNHQSSSNPYANMFI